jgi:hypothetical protein
MVRVTSQGRLGCLLQHCTITGIVRNETTAADEGTEHRRLLAKAFHNLKQCSPTGGLVSLCLRVAARIEGADRELTEPDDFRSWRAVWDTALRTFNVTTAALNKSQLPVDDHLDIFGSLRGCSLACDAFLTFAQEFASMHVFRSLKRLTVSLSVPLKAITEHQFNVVVTKIAAQAQSTHSNLILQGIMQLSHIMPELESLKIHWYNLGDSMSTSLVPSATRQESTVSSASICLKECSLHGIYVSESHLLQFLEAVHPATLTLTDVRLVSGTYAPIFEYLTSPDSPFTYYHLDDLRERRALVHFDRPGSLKFRYIPSVNVGPSLLTQQTSHVKEEIRYRFASGRALGSGELNRWRRSKTEEFGRPRDPHGGYDFIKLNSQKIVAESDESDDS